MFSEKIRLVISCESSAKQMIHMKCQVLFSLKNINKQIKMLSAAVMISTLKVNLMQINTSLVSHFTQF